MYKKVKISPFTGEIVRGKELGGRGNKIWSDETKDAIADFYLRTDPKPTIKQILNNPEIAELIKRDTKGLSTKANVNTIQKIISNHPKTKDRERIGTAVRYSKQPSSYSIMAERRKSLKEDLRKRKEARDARKK